MPVLRDNFTATRRKSSQSRSWKDFQESLLRSSSKSKVKITAFEDSMLYDKCHKNENICNDQNRETLTKSFYLADVK